MSVAEVEEEAVVNIINVDELQNHGINASDLQKLKASGIFTINVCITFLTLTGGQLTNRIRTDGPFNNQKAFGQDQRSERSQGGKN